MSIELISTADGSHSLRNTDLNETYHSQHGAVQESRHVFIANGLQFFASQHPHPVAHVLEVGFGTGLNALLAAQLAERERRIVSYTALEPFPVSREVWEQLNYGTLLNGPDLFRCLHECAWSEVAPMNPFFSLVKHQVRVQEARFEPGQYDVVFFDAFAPAVQPEMWDASVIATIHSWMKPLGVLVTYSARGQLRRDLRALQFTVEALPGAPGKKEMTRATKNT